ncbi:hypothetical protein [Ruegeria arenilitoris]|uniref:hypothetical protein n=1 Tax=Ruegeria arenilitoris TaxID=1173585 RepID=UPI00147A4048|nr:hypothetical protein [Ruegeria arenilitoris]
MSKVFSYSWRRDGGDVGSCFCFVPTGMCKTSYFLVRFGETADAGVVLTGFTPCPYLKHFQVRHIVQWGKKGTFEERIWPSFNRSREACEKYGRLTFKLPKVSLSASTLSMTERTLITLRLKLTGVSYERRLANLVFGPLHLPNLSQRERRCFDCSYFVSRKSCDTAISQCDKPRNVDYHGTKCARKVDYDGKRATDYSLYKGGEK